MKKQHALFLLLFWPFLLWAQLPQLSPQARASLLTCSTGDALYSAFGHTALRITDPVYGLDQVYNYGTFDFDTPNFYGKFVKGDLQYFVSQSSFNHFMGAYQYDNRAVWEQLLALEPEQVNALYQKVNNQLAGEDRYYTYKFIDDNCTTRVRDLINAVIAPDKIVKVGDIKTPYRKVINNYLDQAYWERLGINLIFGNRPDEAATEIFLPDELLDAVAVTQHKGAPLAAPRQVLLNQDISRLHRPWWNHPAWLWVLVALLMSIPGKTVARVGLTVYGLLGLFFCCVGLYSLHREVLWNYNALLFNPFLLLWLPLNRKDSRMGNLISLIIPLTWFFYLLFVMGKAHRFMVLPLLILGIWWWWRLQRPHFFSLKKKEKKG